MNPALIVPGLLRAPELLKLAKFPVQILAEQVGTHSGQLNHALNNRQDMCSHRESCSVDISPCDCIGDLRMLPHDLISVIGGQIFHMGEANAVGQPAQTLDDFMNMLQVRDAHHLQVKLAIIRVEGIKIVRLNTPGKLSYARKQRFPLVLLLPRRHFCSRPLQRLPCNQELTECGEIQLCYRSSSARRNDNESFPFQALQRIANRRSARMIPSRKFILGQPLSRCEIQGNDCLPYDAVQADTRRHQIWFRAICGRPRFNSGRPAGFCRQ